MVCGVAPSAHRPLAAMAREAAALGTYSICVSPAMLPLGFTPGVLVATVCGFPSGKHAASIKAAEAAGTTLREGEAEALSQAAQFRRKRHDLQASQLERLGEQLPLPQLCLPFLFRADLGPEQIDELADALGAQISAMGNWP